MANEAYRAVFLRVHPTGKMVLSLTTESDGQESTYAQLVADELGVPSLDVKVVPADTNRFGDGHGFNTAPSDGTSAAVTSATTKILDKARLLAGAALDASADSLQWDNGAFVAARRRRRRQDDRRHRPVRARNRRPASRRRGWPRCANRLPRLTCDSRNAHARTRERKADGPHAQGRRGCQGGPRPRDRGHVLAGHAPPGRRADGHAARRRALDARARGQRRHDLAGRRPTSRTSSRRSTTRCSRARRSSSARRRASSVRRAIGCRVSGELELAGRRAPIRFELSLQRRAAQRVRDGQADRLRNEAVLRVVRNAQGPRRGAGGRGRAARRSAVNAMTNRRHTHG